MADSADIYCIGNTASFDFTTFSASVVHPWSLSVDNVATWRTRSF
jgi:hypothetical protein